MHVDGFRFDLASILASRLTTARRCPNPPLVWDIDTDPVLAQTKLIAEAWDAAGLYQVGSFAGRTLEGVEREVPRRRSGAFVRGDAGITADLATRLLGSPDLYGEDAPAPYRTQSINFVDLPTTASP
jgi:isoamylase